MPRSPALFRRVSELRRACDQARAAGLRVSLVPTMGALHQGHLSLVEEARRHGEFAVVTIFVNPTQFGAGEDLDRYPRTLDSDLEKLAALEVDAVFAPSVDEIYPAGFGTRVSVEVVTEGLCGTGRPGHFGGVATVVTKLFNIAGPCTAVFGRKDYQQLRMIEKMARDLDIPVKVIGAPTVREPDGLAMSSRNAYLIGEERERALALSRGLAASHELFGQGRRSVGELRRAVADRLEEVVDSVEYIEACDPDTLAPLPDDETAPERVLLAVAARVGETRLIDNTVLGEDDPPV